MSRAQSVSLPEATSQVVALTEEYELIELGDPDAVEHDPEQGSNGVNASASIMTASPTTRYAADRLPCCLPPSGRETGRPLPETG